MPTRSSFWRGERPDAWWLPGTPPQLVVTTAALRRLQGPAAGRGPGPREGARAGAARLAAALLVRVGGRIPRVPVFAAFRDEMHRLVETGRRRRGLAPLRPAGGHPWRWSNSTRGPWRVRPVPDRPGPCPQRVHRLLTPPGRLSAARRLRWRRRPPWCRWCRYLVAFVPGLRALG
ncbi:hypothetical protein LV779_39305 [Streptomyces thinghirensis]|nr:hypothetical protein [Streptomyces thinghirensis]